MKLLTKECDLELLSAEFEHIQFYMLRSDDSLSFISCIVCVCETAQDITVNWRTIQNMVAVYHQHSGGFDAWNMYVAFVTTETIPIWDKYEIENNKFSSRKIILDCFPLPINIEQVVVELEKQLLGSDLTLQSLPFQPQANFPDLQNYYRGAPLDSRRDSRETRALIIDKIIENLNNNEN
ncbi:conserved hypothetical protein [Vibrio coralliirubri]|uniref:ABC-three component system middle component 1 n=1 Tax=Vibrio TaxID=662 RepID=UPI000635AD39|nr:ABC-three component system middle component 1 [Vibrio coralliirubri]CAH7021895.1 conserved hypothetical protein [Vibrio chagasii]CDU08675.1 conserved hypothetical protein [Vibrio coralliirubri]